jgi:NADH-quinone oxidoreductase subunit N
VLGDGGNPWGVALAVVAAVNAVIALFFYARVLKVAFMDRAPDPLPSGAPLSRPLAAALVLTLAVVLAAGFFPQLLAFFGEAARALALP